jgi:hypothetical protein
MVIAILMESDLKLSDDLLEAIIDKVGNNQLECPQPPGFFFFFCVCGRSADVFVLNFPDI